jgi:2-polyprenyl-3-methyl-5-hydroxy-6-metoxy-1,4-benzoquinol methylase/GNAT superfamily N-acetyltransferase
MSNSGNYSYEQQTGLYAAGSESLIAECAVLYSSHYGFWDEPGKLIKRSVRLTPKKLKEWFKVNTVVATARHEGELIAYAIAEQHEFEGRGVVCWVTQLVVHSDHRNLDVAKTLLYSLWGFSNHYCWGLVSANPFAVRALEKATRRRCEPARIVDDKDFLLRFGEKWTSYVTQNTETDVDQNSSQINTRFDLDHSEVPRMVAAVQQYGIDWKLGELRPGWEWMAFTFQDQQQMQLTTLEVQQMLDASEDIVQQAYSRMTLDAGHKWQRHTDAEVDFIIQHCHLREGDSVLDVGCGKGRHTISAAKRGLHALGVDFCSQLIERATVEARGTTATFQVMDFRERSLDTVFDCVVCLYDVIGSAVGRKSELQLLRNIRQHLRPGGYAVVSVMNLTLTMKNATQLFSLETEHNRLLELKPSGTMESSGDIFNPGYYMVDVAEGVVYRKEQFSAGRDLPAELIVRDRRYTKASIMAVAKAVEFEVVECRCVHAGGWEKNLTEDDDSAKEILLVLRKPRGPSER